MALPGVVVRYVGAVSPTEDLRSMVNGERAFELDRAAFLIAQHADPGIDVEAQLRRLDALAESCEPTVVSVSEKLFGQGGFQGARNEYYDPRNSYLNVVLDRQVGIPISLAIVFIEVGRRAGVLLEGVGMPGHFLVRDPATPGRLFDPFDGARALDIGQTEALYRSIAGPNARFDRSMLVSVDEVQIAIRILTNLKLLALRAGNSTDLEWILRLRLHFPGIAVSERVELAAVLGNRGAYDLAADELEYAAKGGHDRSEQWNARAHELRSRLN